MLARSFRRVYGLPLVIGEVNEAILSHYCEFVLFAGTTTWKLNSHILDQQADTLSQVAFPLTINQPYPSTYTLPDYAVEEGHVLEH